VREERELQPDLAFLQTPVASNIMGPKRGDPMDHTVMRPLAPKLYLFPPLPSGGGDGGRLFSGFQVTAQKTGFTQIYQDLTTDAQCITSFGLL
jgi:hypothetical protein